MEGILVFCSVVWTLWWVINRFVRAPRSRNPRCGNCGYDIPTLSFASCPECGSHLLQAGIVPPGMGLRKQTPIAMQLGLWSLAMLFVLWIGLAEGPRIAPVVTVHRTVDWARRSGTYPMPRSPYQSDSPPIWLNVASANAEATVTKTRRTLTRTVVLRLVDNAGIDHEIINFRSLDDSITETELSAKVSEALGKGELEVVPFVATIIQFLPVSKSVNEWPDLFRLNWDSWWMLANNSGGTGTGTRPLPGGVLTDYTTNSGFVSSWYQTALWSCVVIGWVCGCILIRKGWLATRRDLIRVGQTPFEIPLAPS
jgi:hypothetical protein